MNKRIKELMTQARKVAYYADGGYTPIMTVDGEKLAQLIIADAINTVEKRFMGDLNREDMEVRRCVADLKQHFGVYDEQR
jgi:hypothetical protein